MLACLKDLVMLFCLVGLSGSLVSILGLERNSLTLLETLSVDLRI